jgi:hypothetical protein
MLNSSQNRYLLKRIKRSGLLKVMPSLSKYVVQSSGLGFAAFLLADGIINLPRLRMPVNESNMIWTIMMRCLVLTMIELEIADDYFGGNPDYERFLDFVDSTLKIFYEKRQPSNRIWGSYEK